MANVPHPLYISSRLMAACKIEGAGTLHLSAVGRDDEGRILYTWVIEDAEGNEIGTGTDLRSAVRADVDYLATMCTLISFLEYAAEVGTDSDGSLFSGTVTEWAEQYSDEISMARFELDPEMSL